MYKSSVSSCTTNENMNQQPLKKKRNQPGHPEPGAEVIALSPRSLMATNRFVCEVCNKGFQRDQNLQLHRRGHNLPWKLKQRSSKEIVRKKVYICPEVSCVHHDASRALGDLTGIKKHFFRKHGEKKWKCERCSKKYAVQSDWKAHSKICGTREYRCDCGTVFSRRDSFITHRAFCDALAQENGRSIARNNNIPFQTSNSSNSSSQILLPQFNSSQNLPFQIKKEQQANNNFTPPWLSFGQNVTTPFDNLTHFQEFQEYDQNPNPRTLGYPPPPPYISATALLQKAAQMGSKCSTQQFPSPTGVFIKPPNQAHVTSSDNFGSSRDQFMSSFPKAASGSTETGATMGGNSNTLMHEMMMMNSGGFESSAFDDVAFGDIMSSKKDGATTVGEFSNEGGENMTRDFLGLRPLSQSEILSFSGLDNCINGENSCNHD